MMKTITINFSLALCFLLGATQMWAQTTFDYTGTIESYTVPAGVDAISIQAYGAQGGNENGGLGASIYGEFNVTPGQVLNIVVGQQGIVNNCGGPDASGGGGGGSFVWDAADNSFPIVAAGAGGGGNQNWTGDCTAGMPGQAGDDGTSGSEGLAAGGIDGQGGAGDAPSGTGAGGGGWLSVGQNSTYGANSATGGETQPNFTGGIGDAVFGPGGEGGYGGGGGAVCGCGGGGGFSGGAGGNGSTCRAGGGGGGSYNTGMNQNNLGGMQSGNGQIVISEIVIEATCWEPGDGSDGVFNATANMIMTSGTYNYSSFTIAEGVTVNATGNDPLIIYCTGIVTINGTLTVDGTNGTDGITFDSAGIGGSGVAGGGNGGNGIYSDDEGPLDAFDGSNTGGLNTHGTNWSGGGGAGFASAGQDSGEPLGGFGGVEYGSNNLDPLVGGSGAGGGSGGFSCGSGGGGAGGGILAINSSEVIIGANGVVSSNGGHGGSDGTGNCGGGGGGSGGTIWIASPTIMHNGMISAIGGNGGITSQGIGSFGIGGNGADGRIRMDNFSAITGAGTITPASGFNGILMDNSVNQDGNTLTANEADQSYTWVDCDNNNEPIPGADLQSFSPMESGNYACIISNGDCDVISDCIDFTYIGVNELSTEAFRIYPNPAHSILNIETNASIKEITIFNLFGELVQREYKNQFTIEDLASGVYVINIETTQGIEYSRFTKE